MNDLTARVDPPRHENEDHIVLECEMGPVLRLTHQLTKIRKDPSLYALLTLGSDDPYAMGQIFDSTGNNHAVLEDLADRHNLNPGMVGRIANVVRFIAPLRRKAEH